jgi:hypothetical protein
MIGEIQIHECYKNCVSEVGCTLIGCCLYLHPVIQNRAQYIDERVDSQGRLSLKKLTSILQHFKPMKVSYQQGNRANRKERAIRAHKYYQLQFEEDKVKYGKKVKGKLQVVTQFEIFI